MSGILGLKEHKRARFSARRGKNSKEGWPNESRLQNCEEEGFFYRLEGKVKLVNENVDKNEEARAEYQE